VRAEPRSLDEAASVAEEIKRQNPIILNLEGVDKSEARRIRDFLGGVTYGLNGYMRKVGSWVYICAPFDMPVEKLVMDPSRQGRERFEMDREETLSEN
jgi:cell division inhibitor SepF